MSELIIDDSNVKGRAYDFRKKLENTDKLISDYVEILGQIANSSIKSGQVHDAILEFKSCAEKLKGILPDIGKNYENMAESYIDNIDAQDKWLY